MPFTKKQGDISSLDVLRVFLDANVPLKFESLPGMGKTKSIDAVCRATNAGCPDALGVPDRFQTGCYPLVAVTSDPTDFGGVPVPKGDYYARLPAEYARLWLPALVSTKRLVVFFGDEANTAPRSVASALLKVVDERIVGDFPLPPEVRMVLAMNPAAANGGVDLTSAMANRVGHWPWFISPEEWADKLQAGFPDPDLVTLHTDAEFEPVLTKYAGYVARFIRNRPEYLRVYPDDMVEQSGPWPSDRTWTLSTRVMAAADLGGFGDDVRDATCRALVGVTAGDAFSDWLESQTAIDVQQFFTDPDNAPLPTRDDLLIATMDRMVDEAIQGDKDAIQAAGMVLLRVHADGKPGIARACIIRWAQHVQGHRELANLPGVRATLVSFRPILAKMAEREHSTGGSTRNWMECEQCGQLFNAWVHRNAHYAKHHPDFDPKTGLAR